MVASSISEAIRKSRGGRERETKRNETETFEQEEGKDGTVGTVENDSGISLCLSHSPIPRTFPSPLSFIFTLPSSRPSTQLTMAMEMVEEIIEAVVGEDEKVEEKAEGNSVGQQKVLTDLYGKLIHELGEDLDRPGLLKTPERAAKAMLFFTKGYNESLDGKSLFTGCYLSLIFLLFPFRCHQWCGFPHGERFRRHGVREGYSHLLPLRTPHGPILWKSSHRLHSQGQGYPSSLSLLFLFFSLSFHLDLKILFLLFLESILTFVSGAGSQQARSHR